MFRQSKIVYTGALFGLWLSTAWAGPTAESGPDVVPVAQVATSLEIGVGVADITPDVHAFRVPMAGYGAREGKPATGVHDPLRAKVLYLRDGETSMALITCDLRSITPDFKAQILRKSGGLGLSANNLLVAASHTHDGPSIYAEKFWQLQFGAYDPEIVEVMSTAVAGALKHAVESAAPAKVGFGQTVAEGFTRNRRWTYDTAAREAAGETPLTDPALWVMRVDSMDGKPRALLVNFATHPTILGAENMEISAEWPGVLQRNLEEAFPGATVLYTNGAEGDQAPDGARGADDFEKVTDFGTRLARVAESVARAIETLPDVPIGFARSTPALPEFTFTEGAKSRYGDFLTAAVEALPRTAEIQVFRIGPVALAGLPGEPILEVGKAVQQRVAEQGFEHVVVVSLANDYLGYIVNEKEYAHGGYEVDSRSYYGPGLGAFVAGQAARTAQIAAAPRPARGLRYVPGNPQSAEAWQKSLRSKLFGLLHLSDLASASDAIALNETVLDEAKCDGYRLQTIELQSTATRRIRARLAIPDEPVDGGNPAVVAIHGHGGTMDTPFDGENPIYKEFGKALAQRGFVVISTNVGQHEIYEPGRTLMGERLWDLMRCVDYLESRPDVNGQRIGCAGLSLGGEMAMWLGAMDTRMAATVSCGFLTAMDQMEQNHCMCWKFDGLRELVDFADIYALTAPRPLQCQNGRKEPATQFTVALAEKALAEIQPAYNDFNASDWLMLRIHDGGHEIDLEPLVQFLSKHLGASEPVAIVREGQAAAALVLDSHVAQLNREAADDFIGIVQRMTGAVIPASAAGDRTPIYIGEPGEFADLPFAVPALQKEEFLLKVTPEAIYILGGSPLGTSHGVYTLLRDLGCRWVMPGAIGECLPATKDILVPLQDRREIPDFNFREIWYAYGSPPAAAARHDEWMRRNRMVSPPIFHRHNLTATLGRVAPYEERPDLYALLDGERKKTQICTSNPEAVAGVVTSIKQFLAEHPETESYSLCPDDNTDFCECADCKALDPGHLDRGGLPSVADRYQVFLNQVIAGLKDEYPDVLVTTYSYNRSHTDPPVRTPVDPRTCIFATTSEFCSAHGVGDAYCASRQDFRGLLQKWTALTSHVYVYEYDPVPYSGGLPWPMWESNARAMAAYKEIGVAGVYFEGQNSWASYFPDYYIAAQCMWDSSQDGQQLFDDLMISFFGGAAPEMAAYHRAQASVFHGIERKAEWGLVDYPKYFTPAVVESCRQALEAAGAKSVPPDVRRRIEMVRFSFDEMDAYLRIRRADASTTFEDYRAAVEQLGNTIDRMAATNEDYLLANIAHEKTGAGIADRFAPQLGFINRWLLCGPFDNLGMDGHDRVYPPEQATDTAAVYGGKGGRSVSWKTNGTPEWQGYVDLVQEFDDADWTCAYALCWVTLDGGPRDVLFRVGSNDSVKVFLNGGEVWANKVERTASVDDDLVPVTLPAGTSTVLLKIGQAGLNWGFYFRITEPDSLDIPNGLHTRTEPPR